MSQHLFSWPLFSKIPIVGIVRGLGLTEIRHILPVFIESGLTTIEITMNTKDAEKIIRFALESFSGNLQVGAGTICNESDLERALSWGAQFIVTPILNQQVVKKCVDQRIPVFPGAFTPTEIYEAFSAGASMVKVFPASTLGPDYIKNIKAPLDQVKLMPTGGITLDNISAFKAAGADGFGVGSPLFNQALIKQGNWKELGSHFTKFVEKITANN